MLPRRLLPYASTPPTTWIRIRHLAVNWSLSTKDSSSPMQTQASDSFADLKGKTFCFVDPNSTSGYIVPRIILAANGIDPDTDFQPPKTRVLINNVAIAVYKGDCDAGVTYINVLTDTSANLAAQYPDIADKVKVFAVTDPSRMMACNSSSPSTPISRKVDRGRHDGHGE